MYEALSLRCFTPRDIGCDGDDRFFETPQLECCQIQGQLGLGEGAIGVALLNLAVYSCRYVRTHHRAVRP